MAAASRPRDAPGLPGGPAGEGGGAAKGRRLALSELVLTRFRNYENVRLELDGRPVVLTGPNGAGKTNVLEAVSLLSPGRGLRGTALGEATRRAPGASVPGPGWAVFARLRRDGEVHAVGTGLDATERRVVRIDGETVSGSRPLAELVRVVWLTPPMDRLFIEGASGRRRFMDRLVMALDPEHGSRAAAYEQAMRERTRLLKDGSGEAGWLAALEAAMAERGAALTAARRRFVARLGAALAVTPEDSPFPRAEVAIESGLEEDGGGAAFRARLARGRGRDAAAGRALEGPHRADLVVRHKPKDMEARYCSTGEQKALLIGLVLAHARLMRDRDGLAPLLLLDEVAAHLDGLRRAALFDEICALGAQAWMTGTDRALFDALGARAQFFRVGDGHVDAEGG
ncbi:MAG: DNA replication/repair protein RecF [Alphaproteobacteria bacterium]